MKKKISGFGMAIAIVLMAVAVSGCGGKENPLAGTWTLSDDDWDAQLLFVDNVMLYFERGRDDPEIKYTVSLDKNSGTLMDWRGSLSGTFTFDNNTLSLSSDDPMNDITGTYTKDLISKFQTTSKIDGVWRATGPEVELGLVIIGRNVFLSAEGKDVQDYAKYNLDFEKNSGPLMDESYELGTLSLKGKNLVLAMEDESFTFTKVVP